MSKKRYIWVMSYDQERIDFHDDPSTTYLNTNCIQEIYSQQVSRNNKEAYEIVFLLKDGSKRKKWQLFERKTAADEAIMRKADW